MKGGPALERLALAEQVFVDKTGTLTTGSLHVHSWNGSAEIRPLVAALEHHSSHPIAVALSVREDDACEQGAQAEGPGSALRVENPTQLDGLGMTGTINGRRLTVGSIEMMESHSISIPEEMTRWADEFAPLGHTPVFVAEEGGVVAVAAVSGGLRPEATEFVSRLERLGLPVSMLTGDRVEAARSVAKRVGVDPARVIATATPEAKIEKIRESQKRRAGVDGSDAVIVMIGGWRE